MRDMCSFVVRSSFNIQRWRFMYSPRYEFYRWQSKWYTLHTTLYTYSQRIASRFLSINFFIHLIRQTRAEILPSILFSLILPIFILEYDRMFFMPIISVPCSCIMHLQSLLKNKNTELQNEEMQNIWFSTWLKWWKW